MELRDEVVQLAVWVDTTTVEVFADGGAVAFSEQTFTADDPDIRPALLGTHAETLDHFQEMAARADILK